jgi:glutamine amidotransferase
MASSNSVQVVVIDHGLCNMNSIVRALEYCGGEVRIADSPSDLVGATHYVLPGVGAFPAAMEMLRNSGLADALTEAVLGRGVPILGICLGMQLMMTASEEIEETRGLGWIPGRVCRIEPGPGDRVPHVGWNTVEFDSGFPLSAAVEGNGDFYFVHSFHVVPEEPEVIAGTTLFAGTIVSAVQKGSISGVQFHPEKSQSSGFSILRTFLTSDHSATC